MDVLLISSNKTRADFIRNVLKVNNFTVIHRKRISTALKASRDFQVQLIDYDIEDGTQLECLENMMALNSQIVPIAVVENGDTSMCKSLRKAGTYFFITDPSDKDDILETVKKAFEVVNLKKLKGYSEVSIEDFLREKLKRWLKEFRDIKSSRLYESIIGETEKALLRITLEETGRNKSEVSRILGLNRNTVNYKVKKYKI